MCFNAKTIQTVPESEKPSTVLVEDKETTNRLKRGPRRGLVWR